MVPAVDRLWPYGQPVARMGFRSPSRTAIKISDLGVIVKERAEIITKERLLHNKTISGTKKRLPRQKNDYATKKRMTRQKNEFRKSPGNCSTAPHLETNLLIEGFVRKSYGNAGLRGK